MPQIDIYRLSRLAFAEVTGWRAMLQELRRDQKYAFLGYAPLRRGAVKLLRLPDRGSDDEIKDEIVAEAKDAAWVSRNLRAYHVFKGRFAPHLTICEEVFMGRWAEMPGISFVGDVELVGGPHFSARGADGRTKFVYLHPATSWRPREIDAFCELLCYSVAERFGAGPPEVWFLSLAQGHRISYRPKKRVLKRCREAAELLFGSAMI